MLDIEQITTMVELAAFMDSVKRELRSCYDYSHSLDDAYSDAFLWAAERLPLDPQDVHDKYLQECKYGGRNPVQMFSSSQYDFEDIDTRLRHAVGLQETPEPSADTPVTSVFLRVFKKLGVEEAIRDFLGNSLAEKFLAKGVHNSDR